MKNLSLFLNAILLVAVGVLFYLHFSKPKAKSSTTVRNVPAVSTDSAVSGMMIAYVELDSLNEHITVIKNKRKEIEREQNAIETEWERGYRGLENQKNNFLKRGDAITQEEAMKMQESLLRQQDEIDNKKMQSTQRLGEKSMKAMETIQKDLKDFIEEYNRDKGFTFILTTGAALDFMLYKDSAYDITRDVIDGMNERMKAKP